MKETAHIFVKLRVPDLVALTAKGVIIKNMKVNQLVDVQREDWWQIQISGEKEVESYARDIVEKSSLFVNPNKHSYELRVTDYGLNPPELTTNSQLAICNTQLVYVGVWHYDDQCSDVIKRTLRERLLYEKVERVKMGCLWTLKIRSKTKLEAKKVAEEICLCRNRKRGLLSNPHINYYQVF